MGMNLMELKEGQSGRIVSIRTAQSLQARLRALNVSVGRVVRVLHFAPFDGGVMLDAEGVRLALRPLVARAVLIESEEGR